MAYANSKNRHRRAQLSGEPPALRRRALNGAPCAAEDRRHKAGGSFRIIQRQLIGFAILWSLAPLCRAAPPAAPGASPTFVLRGTVVDEKGGAVAHVTVATAAGRDPDVDLAAASDAAGNFTLNVATWQSQVNLWAK